MGRRHEGHRKLEASFAGTWYWALPGRFVTVCFLVAKLPGKGSFGG